MKKRPAGVRPVQQRRAAEIVDADHRLVAPERRLGTAFKMPAACELRKAGSGPGVLTGYAARFDSLSEPIMGMFRETIRRGAFARSLKDDDQVALWQHDAAMPLGRRSTGTLKLREDWAGLRVEIALPDSELGATVREAVARGDVKQMSFGFRVREELYRKDRADDGLPIRELLDAELIEVSPVTWAAYSETSVGVKG